MIPRPADQPVDPGPFRDELRAIYRDLDAELERLGPICQLSGRCCRFEEYGHTLFLSTAEAALLLADAPRPSRPLDQGQTCPWQNARGRCCARDGRPLGCRIYFCDPSYEAHAQELSELFIARLKRLSEQFGIAWGYAPLHAHLAQAQAEGRFPPSTELEHDALGRVADSSS